MKNIMNNPFLTVAVLTATVFFQVSCARDAQFTRPNFLEVNSTEGYTSANLSGLQYNLDNLPVESLSDGEIKSILQMREEEKLARDAYLKFNEKWSLNIFHNISKSEQTHMDAVLQLIKRYNLSDPVGSNQVGVFVDDNLRALYNLIVPPGEADLVEALKTGALIEEVDISDLEYALKHVVDNQDIRMVYENLIQASQNHLRAFVRNLDNRGVNYIPQRLPQETFDAIINGEWKTGN